MPVCRKPLSNCVLATAFAVGLLAAGLFAASPRAALAADAAADDSARIVNVVSAFYADYSKCSDAEKDPCNGEDIPAFLAKRPDVEPEFTKKITGLVANAYKEPDGEGLEFDPILLAQEAPEKISYDTPIIAGDSAEMIMHKGSAEFPSVACIALSKKDGAWRIRDIIDMDDQETRPACGGLQGKR